MQLSTRERKRWKYCTGANQFSDHAAYTGREAEKAPVLRENQQEAYPAAQRFFFRAWDRRGRIPLENSGREGL
ncbi:hypothetical protein HHX47_DHR5000792, partial [Lentinula edodes]